MFCSNECGTGFDKPGISVYVADEILATSYWGHYCSHACALQDMGSTFIHYIQQPEEAVPAPEFEGSDDFVFSPVPGVTGVAEALADIKFNDTAPPVMPLSGNDQVLINLIVRADKMAGDVYNFLFDKCKELLGGDVEQTPILGGAVVSRTWHFSAPATGDTFSLYTGSDCIILKCHTRGTENTWNVQDFFDHNETWYDVVQAVKLLLTASQVQ